MTPLPLPPSFLRQVPRLALLLALAAPGCGERVSRALPPGDYTPRHVEDEIPEKGVQREKVRREALARAQVLEAPPRPLHHADLSMNPDPANQASDVVTCKFLLKSSGGRSPKFQCILPGGEIVKVKYGSNNPETFGEVAATRLLAALGFGADRMYVVDRVRCFGCPSFPYPKVSIFDALRMDRSKVSEFELAVVERRLPGLEAGGWGWPDLAQVRAENGGATAAELDALRLMAVFLGNWDGKPENERILCRPEGRAGEGPCPRPLAYMQDVGQTFGPKSVDLDGWAGRPVWADPATCRVSMKGMPWDGSTFADVAISEGGRALLAARLSALSETQVTGMFEGARFTRFFRNPAAADTARWTRVFMDRVRQIATATCPTP